MPSAALAALHAYLLANAGAAGTALAEFVVAYFGNADPDELDARGSTTLMAMAKAHVRLLDALDTPLVSRVRVFNPTLAEDGFTSDHTVVQIIHDDMPFLVDSVTMAVNRLGRMAHWIVHPLLIVSRDVEHRLARTVSASSQGRQDARVLSFILVECDRIVAKDDRDRLNQELIQVLNDVRAAVSDWPAMLQRLQRGAAASAGSTLSKQGQEEGVAFLNWLERQHFTFLGARDYDLRRKGEVVHLVAVNDSGLGILRGPAQTTVTQLSPDAHALLASDQLVLVTKAMTRATVHRPAWLDYIAVKRFDAAGEVVGESRFLGLYTSKAYAAAVSDIPLIRRRVAHVMDVAGVVPESHTAKSLQVILETYPRDELLQIDTDTLTDHAMGILRLQERQRTRVFLRRDPYGRFTSVLVFVPRDRYNTDLRARMGEVLLRALDGMSIEFTPMLTDHPLARIHYIVRAQQQAPHHFDVAALQANIAVLARRWEDDCKQALLHTHGDQLGLVLANRFAEAFSGAYRQDFSALLAAEDAFVLHRLTPESPLAVRLYRPVDTDAGMLRLKVYNRGKVALSDSLPVLERMGVRVLDEHPYRVSNVLDGADFWIHDLGLQVPDGADFGATKDRFEHLFLQVWHGEVESDDLNKLLLVTSLDARAIAVLRAYVRYFKQIGFAFSQSYIETTLYKNAAVTQVLYALFVARFSPELGSDRVAAQAHIDQSLESLLTQVVSLEEDRVLRQFQQTILATLRTNAWQSAPGGISFKPYLSFKLNSHAVPGLPEPRPVVEIWVYSPRFEAIHLRNGKVARGGLRWSDRREDFRTEILGLVKAQQVKNTVIVPVGSKGGFVLKNAPPMADRDAFMAEGIACYRLFLSGLLDLTDNLEQGRVVPPRQVVRHDQDDTYLVVAADKGTASFSDIANSVSAQYGFWLGDAFASGGSVGYDHKKMGITARGAWESTQRHFRSLSVNTQTTAFTVVGIGDMSGDVFGNGMLLSQHICLVAAFDHRHIFIDPHPDGARSFAERKRLFDLPRSSWDDFDPSVLSEGGGVYARSAKSITLSEAARSVLAIDAVDIAPLDLLHAILKAPVDLLFNGGIGTYVKSSQETHAQVGDKAGDAFRANGNQLRCKVLVEGGNLGCTQRGRIEFAQQGGLIYTDAIDNSAGVDCSDHEVNIKILLDRVVEAGDLTLKQRNDLLASMTQEVAKLVLTDNYYQTQAINVALHRVLYVLDGQQRLIQLLERSGRLHRAIEFLPTDEDIARRKVAQRGLTAPEVAVVMAYAKIWVFDDLVASDLPDDPYFDRELSAYFPQILSQQYGSGILAHPLKREIIATRVANNVVNRMGATFVSFLTAEAAATTAEVVRAYTLSCEIFDLEPLWLQIDALDAQLSSECQLELLCKLMSTAQRAARWMLRLRGQSADLPTLIAHYQPAARALYGQLQQWMPQLSQVQWATARNALVQAGVADALADRLSALDFIFPALDLVDLAQSAGTTLEQAARTYFAVEDQLKLMDWRVQINRLPTDTLWQTQARGSARDDVYAIASQITQTVLQRHTSVADWAEKYAKQIERLARLQQSIATQQTDLAPITVVLRELRHLA